MFYDSNIDFKRFFSCFPWNSFCFIMHIHGFAVQVTGIIKTWQSDPQHNKKLNSVLFQFLPTVFGKLNPFSLCAMLFSCIRPGAFWCTLLSARHAINYLDVGGGIVNSSLLFSLSQRCWKTHRHLNQSVVTLVCFVGECFCKGRGRSTSCLCWSAWLSLFHWSPGGFKQLPFTGFGTSMPLKYS